jgi:D-lactate dehydrogenase
MKVAVFDSHRFDREAFEEANVAFGHELHFLEPRLTRDTAILAAGFAAVCSFVNDRIDADALAILREGGVRLIAPAIGWVQPRGSRQRGATWHRRRSGA